MIYFANFEGFLSLLLVLKRWAWGKSSLSQWVDENRLKAFWRVPLNTYSSDIIVKQTWNLSNILHNRIFGPTILHSKNMYIAAIFANIKAEYMSIWVSLIPFIVEIEMNM